MGSEIALLLFIGQDVGSIKAYVDATRKVPAGCMVYTSLKALHGLSDPIDYGAGVQHAGALLQAYPKTALQIGFWLVDSVEGIAQGLYDANISRFAQWLKASRCPVYLRVGYEFDLPENRYEPQAYVRGYRYLVDRLRKEAGSAVAYVWHSFASSGAYPLSDWYPGDDYVDWCAVSIFDQRYEQLIPMAEFAKSHRKPLMIAEATPRGIGTGHTERWAQWWARVRRYMDDYSVAALSYINTDWESQPMFKGQGWGDSRIEANDAVKRLWLEEINRPCYTKASLEAIR